jgi:hypothetical protein
VPLGCYTSRQFVNHFLDSERVRRLDKRDLTILQFTNWLRGEAVGTDVGLDIEMMLTLLEANAADGERLRTDQLFVRTVLSGQTKPLEQFIGPYATHEFARYLHECLSQSPQGRVCGLCAARIWAMAPGHAPSYGRELRRAPAGRGGPREPSVSRIRGTIATAEHHI